MGNGTRATIHVYPFQSMSMHARNAGPATASIKHHYATVSGVSSKNRAQHRPEVFARLAIHCPWQGGRRPAPAGAGILTILATMITAYW